MNKRIHPLLAVAAAIGSFFLGAVADHFCTSLPRDSYLARPGRSDDVSGSARGFDVFVKRWNAFVVRNDGVIPADPNRGLVDSEIVESYDELRGIVFNSYLPPRINPDLKANPKRVVFWTLRDDVDEVWSAYADGTWARVPISQDAAQDNDWRKSIEMAGYPQWRSLKEKDRWIGANRDKLVWDDRCRIYVVRK